MQIPNDQASLVPFASVSFVLVCLSVCLFVVPGKAHYWLRCQKFFWIWFCLLWLPHKPVFSWSAPRFLGNLSALEIKVNMVYDWISTVERHAGGVGGRLNVIVVTVSSNLIGPAQAAFCHAVSELRLSLVTSPPEATGHESDLKGHVAQPLCRILTFLEHQRPITRSNVASQAASSPISSCYRVLLSGWFLPGLS